MEEDIDPFWRFYWGLINLCRGGGFCISWEQRLLEHHGRRKCVIYPYSILNSALNFHFYFTLWCFWCFWCLPIPYSDIFLFWTPTFPTFPTVFWHLSAFQCSPYSDISKILLFHSMLRCYPMFSLFLYMRNLFGATMGSLSSWNLFPKHHNLRSIMDSLWMQ